MTNPTLERAARALCAATEADWDAISPTRRQYVVTAVRSVLMAVLPELERVTPEEQGPVGRGWMEDVVSPDGEYVRYGDLTAIPAEGE